MTIYACTFISRDISAAPVGLPAINNNDLVYYGIDCCPLGKIISITAILYTLTHKNYSPMVTALTVMIRNAALNKGFTSFQGPFLKVLSKTLSSFRI